MLIDLASGVGIVERSRQILATRTDGNSPPQA
jgi:hypothetical protein